MLILILTILLVSQFHVSNGKYVKLWNKLGEGTAKDFFYCTKFTTGVQQRLKVDYKVSFVDTKDNKAY